MNNQIRKPNLTMKVQLLQFISPIQSLLPDFNSMMINPNVDFSCFRNHLFNLIFMPCKFYCFKDSRRRFHKGQTESQRASCFELNHCMERTSCRNWINVQTKEPNNWFNSIEVHKLQLLLRIP